MKSETSAPTAPEGAVLVDQGYTIGHRDGKQGKPMPVTEMVGAVFCTSPLGIESVNPCHLL